jgi:hypothetical protein
MGSHGEFRVCCYYRFATFHLTNMRVFLRFYIFIDHSLSALCKDTNIKILEKASIPKNKRKIGLKT